MLHLCLRWPLPTPKLWLRVISLVVLLTGIVLFSVPASAALYPSDASVVGKWNLIVTFPDGHTEASQVIFNRNGVFVNLTPGPGGGKWFPTEQDLTFRYIFSESILVNVTLPHFHGESKCVYTSHERGNQWTRQREFLPLSSNEKR